MPTLSSDVVSSLPPARIFRTGRRSQGREREDNYQERRESYVALIDARRLDYYHRLRRAPASAADRRCKSRGWRTLPLAGCAMRGRRWPTSSVVAAPEGVSMATRKPQVRLAASFERNLDEIAEFLPALMRPRPLTHCSMNWPTRSSRISNAFFREMGRPFMAREVCSVGASMRWSSLSAALQRLAIAPESAARIRSSRLSCAVRGAWPDSSAGHPSSAPVGVSPGRARSRVKRRQRVKYTRKHSR